MEDFSGGVLCKKGLTNTPIGYILYIPHGGIFRRSNVLFTSSVEKAGREREEFQ